MVNNMQITFLTVFWSIVAILSIIGLYWFNTKRGVLNFVTSRKYLALFILAAMFGMRQNNWVAFLLSGGALFLMSINYKPYIEMCRQIKRMQEHKQ